MLTLVTATLNAARLLDRAIASAAGQGVAYQHIVVDGGSSDETAAICARTPAIDFVLAPGSSIYQAWNIGIERALGEAILFLNADDELAPGALAAIERTLSAQPEAQIVAGHALVEDDDVPTTPLVRHIAAPGGVLSVARLVAGVPVINAMAFRPSLFRQYAQVETRYRIAGDRAFLLNLALAAEPPRIAPIDAVLYRYHVHSGSLTLRRSLEQRLRVARDHLALSRQLLAERPSAEAASWLRHMRRREAAVAGLRCLAAGRPLEVAEFLRGLFG
ncbi:MAG TPA: glycosyltransferase [Stellaceae bacterium]|jgi:glycosyltransferase involved in cell wall biosynthesis|nr:glycosyltransferase [Stellaceae bacterium]